MLTPEFPLKFMSASSFKAVIRSNKGNEPVLIEMRKRFDGSWKVFTVVANEIVHTSSLQELLLTGPPGHELIITHEIRVLWNGESRQAQLHEIYASTPEEQVQVSIRLR